jgi:hypothetical protein
MTLKYNSNHPTMKIGSTIDDLEEARANISI